MAFAIKAQVEDPQATLFAFTAQKTMYGGKNVSEGELIFVFVSDEDGLGLVARGVVTSAEAVPRRRGTAPANAACERNYQTHRTRETIARSGSSQTSHQLGRRPTWN